jgi:hypothetical protein
MTSNDLTVAPVKHSAPLRKSDHDLLMFSLEISFSTKSPILKRRNFRGADYILINNIISVTDWEDELSGLDDDTQLDILNSFLINVIHTFIPISTYSATNRPRWLDHNTRTLINKKKRVYRNLQTQSVAQQHGYL